MKTAATLLISFCFYAAQAQHKKSFFDNLYISAMVGGESFKVDQSQWKNMYRYRTNIPYLLDTMKTVYRFREFAYLPKIDGEFSAGAGKLLLPEGRWPKERNLEWRTSLHYKIISYSPSQFGFSTDQYQPTDTTRPTEYKYITLQQHKRILDWQHVFVYNSRYFLKGKFRLNIGSGIGISTTTSNTISESFYGETYTWNTTLHSFHVKTDPVTNSKYAARAETHLSYILYLGTTYRLGSRLSLTTDGYYSIAHYKYSADPKKTEGYWIGLTFCYPLYN